MSIHIDQVLEYLDTHRVCQRCDTVPSLMERLCEIYLAHDDPDSEHIRCLIGQTLTAPAASEIIRVCARQEQQAFAQGVLTGMQLMTEVNRLP